MINNFDGLITSRSIMSLGKGTSGFSPVSTVGMLAFLISFSTNPVQFRESMIQYSTTVQTSYLRCPQWNEKSVTGLGGGETRLNVYIETQISKLHSCCLTGSVTGWITGRNNRTWCPWPELRVYLNHDLLSFLSISSHLLTSFTNLRWNTFTSGFSYGWKKKRGNSYFDKIISDIWVKPTVTNTQEINQKFKYMTQLIISNKCVIWDRKQVRPHLRPLTFLTGFHSVRDTVSACRGIRFCSYLHL